MIIGIDASFLRKPGTGIGQVTEQALLSLSRLSEAAHHRFILYLEEYADPPFQLPGNFEKHVFLPGWKRDDVPRRFLWERQLASVAEKDGCSAFISLSQSATVFPEGSGVRHLMVVHDIVPILFPAYRGKFTNRVHSEFVERAILSAERILTVSKTTKRDLVLNLGIPEDRIATAYPDCAPRFRQPVEEARAVEVRKRYGLESGYIYHGGGLEIRKNTGRLLEAYAQLSGKRDDVPPLVISGTIHGRRNRLATDVEGIVRKLGIGDHVKMLGFVPDHDLPALYRDALLFAFPSLYEGFGIPIIEAFAIGTPVLAGRTAGAVPEVAGTAAMLVDTQHVSEIVAGLEKIMDDGTYREALIERGRERSKVFSWESFSAALLSETVPATIQSLTERNTETLTL